MTARTHRRVMLSSALGIVTLLASVLPGAAAEPPDGWSATGLEPVGRVEGFKSASADLVKSDPDLIKRTDADRVPVMVKLDYDALASYAGGIEDLAATSPRVTGKDLTGKSRAETAYTGYIKGEEAAIVKAMKAAAPSIKVGTSLRTVYGGVTATLTAREAKALLKVPGVVAVQHDSLDQLLTDSSSDFIDATQVQQALGGRPNAGSGVIYGNLDSGVWPEHPSFADQGHLSAPPPKADGTPRTCNFGDNPLTPAADVFACNDKLIGGAPFLATYLSDPGRAAAEPYHTARDSNGHGSHTASTSAGNRLASAPVFGVNRGPINGIAPGAWLSVYKVCGISGCFASDSAAAVAAGDPRWRRRHQLLDLGRRGSVHRSGRAGVPRRVRRRRVRLASAGNDGPGASTANHLSPWVTTVAASTQTREFASTLTVDRLGRRHLHLAGRLDHGRRRRHRCRSCCPRPPPYSRTRCADAPAPAGLFTGKIVACQRGEQRPRRQGLQRVAGRRRRDDPLQPDARRHRDRQPLAADGPPGRRHRLRRLHGRQPDVHRVASPPASAGRPGRRHGRLLVARPGRLVIKPDITAPGVQILAGMTPTPEAIVDGPPGEYFQAIAGTSMSSPHIAGAALLLKAAPPDVDARPDQVGADDDGHRPMSSRRTSRRRPIRSTIGAGRVDVDDADKAPADLRRDRGRLLRPRRRPADGDPPEHPVDQRPGHARPGHHDPDGQERDQPAHHAWTSRPQSPAGLARSR